MKTRRLLILLLIGVLGLGGCSSSEYDLPTLGGKPRNKESDLEVAAKTYFDCMTDAGIEVELSTNGHGDLTIVNFSMHSGWILMRDANGGGMAMMGENAEIDQAAMDAFFSNPDAGPALMIDGVDYTEAYVRCIAESGYDEQAAWGDGVYRADPAEMERQVKANNDWAACARDHGFPSIKDSTMPTKMDGSEWPAVTLPGTITEDQLRTLLDACPNFDPKMEDRRNSWWEENPGASAYPDDLLPDPSINFDFAEIPGSDDKNWTPSPEEQIILDRMSKLYEVLYEKMNEYWEGR